MSSESTLSRRSLMGFGLGRSGPVNDDGNVQLMQVQMTAAETRDNTPVLHDFGFTSNAPVGSTPAYASQLGDRSKAVVIGMNHAPSRPRGLTPGQTQMYDLGGASLFLTGDGNGTLTLTGTLTTVAPKTMWIGDIMLTGSLTATGDVIAGPTTISLINHTHISESPGDPTSAPIAGT